MYFFYTLCFRHSTEDFKPFLYVPTYAQKRCINRMYKSNYWPHVFTRELPAFDQDICLCCWLLHLSYVYKYFDSESYWFYIENKNVFFSVILQAFKRYIYLHIQGTKRAPDWRKPTTHKELFSKQTCLKKEWRNLLHY